MLSLPMETASHAADWNYGTDRVGNASMGTGTEWRDSERYCPVVKLDNMLELAYSRVEQ